MSSEEALSLFVDVQSPVAPEPDAHENASTSIAAAENHWLWFGTERDRVRAQYRVVPATWLLPSHEWRSLRPRAGHPPGLQSRRYDGDPGEFARLTIESQALSPSHVLDRTFFAWSGPPVCRADGVVVAGNQRAIMILRAAYGDREGGRARYEEYCRELEQRRSLWGIPSGPLPEAPVLVRVIVDDGYDDLESATPAFARLNRLSDRAASKAYDPVSAGSALADDLEQSPEILEALLTRARDQRLGSFLAAADGHEIVALLTRANAISVSEHGGMIDPRSNRLTEGARRRIEDAVALIALGRRRDLLERAPRKIRKRLGSSCVQLALSAKRPRGVFARTAIIDALELLLCTSIHGLSGDAIIRRCEAHFGRQPTKAGRAFASFFVHARAADVLWVLSDWLAIDDSAPELFDAPLDEGDSGSLPNEWEALLRSPPSRTARPDEEVYTRAREICETALREPADHVRGEVETLKRDILPDLDWDEFKPLLRSWWPRVDESDVRGRGRPAVSARAVITLLVFFEAHGRRDSRYFHWDEFAPAFAAGSWTTAWRRMLPVPGDPERDTRLKALDAALDRAAKAYARRAFNKPAARTR